MLFIKPLFFLSCFVFSVYIGKKNPTSLLVYTFTRIVLIFFFFFYHVSHSWGGRVTLFECTHGKEGTGWGWAKDEDRHRGQLSRGDTEKATHRTKSISTCSGAPGTGDLSSLSSASPGSGFLSHHLPDWFPSCEQDRGGHLFRRPPGMKYCTHVENRNPQGGGTARNGHPWLSCGPPRVTL